MARYASELICVTDQPGDYHLETNHMLNKRTRLFFGAVRIGKSYVSYHLMPVYVFSDMLVDLSPELRRRMQGKSCFNFKRPDGDLFAELNSLTETGFQRYRAAGYV
jgi:hypothetical protein